MKSLTDHSARVSRRRNLSEPRGEGVAVLILFQENNLNPKRIAPASRDPKLRGSDRSRPRLRGAKVPRDLGGSKDFFPKSSAGIRR